MDFSVRSALVETRGFSDPVVYEQVRKKYVWDSSASGVSWNMVRGRLVYGAAGLTATVDVEGGGHVGHGHSFQQGAGGVGQHGGKTAGHGQGQHDVCGDQVE